MCAGDPARRLDAVHPGHPHVHEHDIGEAAAAVCSLGDDVECFLPVSCRRDDVDIRCFSQHQGEPRARQVLVVDQHDADPGNTCLAGGRHGFSSGGSARFGGVAIAVSPPVRTTALTTHSSSVVHP
ncbi:hypothetical protein SDC9_101242 [bioreactor metagenome]|uniref:Uncharacterized protein n=1 Tax=bioreactor metagenome TaxID=1076179 RepID=A0A645AY61_9ZZZZ